MTKSFMMEQNNSGTSTDPRKIHIQNYIYDLPDERIARHPLAQRDACKLLVARRGSGIEADTVFAALPDYLPQNTLLVYNNTRVINARLRFRKETGALIEVFCLEPVSPADYETCFGGSGPVVWKCLVGNSKRWNADTALHGLINIDGQDLCLTAERIETLPGGESLVRLSWDSDASFARVIDAAGEIPIPPYLNRASEQSDRIDYQTVFSRIDGSVAAPTAGLHFTPEVLAALDAKGIERAEVTLHVGAGTFRPVKSECIGEHEMHSEAVVVERDLIQRLAYLAPERPLIAVGTTSVRTLESLYHCGCLIGQGRWDGVVPQWYAYSDEHPRLTRTEAMRNVYEYLDANDMEHLTAHTRLMIAPSYRYMMVDGMITNFHQPGSTLLLLVSAMIGDPMWREVYEYALAHGYRFLSYGDACLFFK